MAYLTTYKRFTDFVYGTPETDIKLSQIFHRLGNLVVSENNNKSGNSEAKQDFLSGPFGQIQKNANEAQCLFFNFSCRVCPIFPFLRMASVTHCVDKTMSIKRRLIRFRFLAGSGMTTRRPLWSPSV